MRDLTIVYDGECPVCRNFSQRVKVDENVGSVKLVDARKPGADRQDLTNRNYDLDQGMVVRFDEQIYFGADAINFLARVNSRSDFLNRLIYLMFRSRTMSSLLYPALRAGRNFLLWVMNVPMINNLKKDLHDA